MRTIFKVAIGVLLAATVLVIGCVALLGAGADQVADELDKQQKANSISIKQYRATKTGTTQKAIEKRFGDPADAQEFETEVPELDAKSAGSCIYYNRRGGEIGDLFQFCFDDGKLTSKNAY